MERFEIPAALALAFVSVGVAPTLEIVQHDPVRPVVERPLEAYMKDRQPVPDSGQLQDLEPTPPGTEVPMNREKRRAIKYGRVARTYSLRPY